MKFLNTAAGSWLKVFITIILVLIVEHGSIFGLDYKGIFSAAVVGVLPIIINFLNPNDHRYGTKK